MDFELTTEQQDIQRAAREFANGTFDKDLAMELEHHHRFPREIKKEAAKLGFIGIHFPEEYGGQAYGNLENCLIAEEFCRRDSGIGLALSFCCFGSGIILRYGRDDQKKRYVLPLTQGDAICSGAFTEPDHGSDINLLFTTAVKEGKEYIVNGNKIFITNIQEADFAVVLCQTNPEAISPRQGQSTIIVESNRKGFESSFLDKMGWKMSVTGMLSLNEVRVPQENLVGEEGQGFYQAVGYFNEIRVEIGATGIGIAQGSFDRALDYAKKREQFGSRIGDFQIIRHKLAEMATRIEAARLLTHKAAWELDKGIANRKLISMSKWYSARTAVEVADEAIEILGGHGYVLENEVERFYRDARALEIVEGTREIHKNAIARALVGKG